MSNRTVFWLYFELLDYQVHRKSIFNWIRILFNSRSNRTI